MKLDYKFKDKSLLDLALTHRGVNAGHNNERLEFVGDRVLGLTVAGLLYDMFPNENEGQLARRFAFLVSTETLADVAIDLGLDKKLHHGNITAGRIRHTMANTMEAVLGAIYFDAGFEVAREIILGIWRDLAAAEPTAPKDAKTTLQELVQKHNPGGELPKYEFLEQKGPVHNPTFVVSVAALGQSATGKGTSKKAASLNAAEELLKKLAI